MADRDPPQDRTTMRGASRQRPPLLKRLRPSRTQNQESNLPGVRWVDSSEPEHRVADDRGISNRYGQQPTHRPLHEGETFYVYGRVPPTSNQSQSIRSTTSVNRGTGSTISINPGDVEVDAVPSADPDHAEYERRSESTQLVHPRFSESNPPIPRSTPSSIKSTTPDFLEFGALSSENLRGTENRGLQFYDLRNLPPPLPTEEVPPQALMGPSRARNRDHVLWGEERRRIREGVNLARHLGELHTRLHQLIRKEENKPRYSRVPVPDSRYLPEVVYVPSELQRAIDSGAIIDPPQGRPYPAGFGRGLDTELEALLRAFPGARVAYIEAAEKEYDAITHELQLDLLLQIVDTIDVLLNFGVGTAAALALRRIRQRTYGAASSLLSELRRMPFPTFTGVSGIGISRLSRHARFSQGLRAAIQSPRLTHASQLVYDTFQLGRLRSSNQIAEAFRRSHPDIVQRLKERLMRARAIAGAEARHFRGSNLASAAVLVDNEILILHQVNKNSLHSEGWIIGLAGQLRLELRTTNVQILALLTERAPCNACRSQISDAAGQLGDMAVFHLVPYGKSVETAENLNLVYQGLTSIR